MSIVTVGLANWALFLLFCGIDPFYYEWEEDGKKEDLDN